MVRLKSRNRATVFQGFTEPIETISEALPGPGLVVESNDDADFVVDIDETSFGRLCGDGICLHLTRRYDGSIKVKVGYP